MKLMNIKLIILLWMKVKLYVKCENQWMWYIKRKINAIYIN